MGPRRFFPWISDNGCKPTYPYVSAHDQFVVDFKGELYRLAWSIPANDPDFRQTLATLILERYKPFAFVMFVNDGNKMDESHPKFEEVCKRKNTKLQQRENVKRKKEELEQTEHPFFEFTDMVTNQPETPCESDVAFKKRERGCLENLERAARGVSFEDTVEVGKLVIEQQSGNMCFLQCEQEADQQLILLASQFTYVVSNDADILVGGANNFLRDAFTPKQACWSATDICKQLRVNLTQLQEITSLSGNDYTSGIHGLGLIEALPLIQKYGNTASMLKNWTPFEHKKKYKIPSNILERIAHSVRMYQTTSTYTEEEEVAQSVFSTTSTHTEEQLKQVEPVSKRVKR